MKSYHPNTPKLVGVTMLFLVVGAVLYSLQTQTYSKQTTNVQPVDQSAASETLSASIPGDAISAELQTQSEPNQQNTAQTIAARTIYKDGNYSASVNYSVPERGSNSLVLHVTIKNDMITAVSSDSTYSGRESSRYVGRFEDSLSGAVVGKKLDSVSPSRIGGASLTTNAFNKALRSVITNAQS